MTVWTVVERSFGGRIKGLGFGLRCLSWGVVRGARGYFYMTSYTLVVTEVRGVGKGDSIDFVCFY